MSKFENDKIEAEIDLRATKAEEEIHRLAQATAELRKQNQSYRKEMAAVKKADSVRIQIVADSIVTPGVVIYAPGILIEAHRPAVVAQRSESVGAPTPWTIM